MIKGYSIPAIPTRYKGRQYRSRLEARWAAFFDFLGWNHEYEPADLGAWSPDFALWGTDRQAALLVEVKPIDRWDRAVARKMADACDSVFFDRSPGILLLGVMLPNDLGWIGRWTPYEWEWTEALLAPSFAADKPDIASNSDDPIGKLWGADVCRPYSPPEIQASWVAAANAVQWRPPV